MTFSHFSAQNIFQQSSVVEISSVRASAFSMATSFGLFDIFVTILFRSLRRLDRFSLLLCWYNAQSEGFLLVRKFFHQQIVFRFVCLDFLRPY